MGIFLRVTSKCICKIQKKTRQTTKTTTLTNNHTYTQLRTNPLQQLVVQNNRSVLIGSQTCLVQELIECQFQDDATVEERLPLLGGYYCLRVYLYLQQTCVYNTTHVHINIKHTHKHTQTHTNTHTHITYNMQLSTPT